MTTPIHDGEQENDTDTDDPHRRHGTARAFALDTPFVHNRKAIIALVSDYPPTNPRVIYPVLQWVEKHAGGRRNPLVIWGLGWLFELSTGTNPCTQEQFSRALGWVRRYVDKGA